MTSKVDNLIEAKGDIRSKWDGVPIEPSFNDGGYLAGGLTTDEGHSECSLLRPKLQIFSRTRDETPSTSLFQFDARRATFVFTLAHSENKEDEIYTPDLQKMASALGTKACETEFIVVGYEHKNIKIAIKLKSQVPVNRIVKKIFAFFQQLFRRDNVRRRGQTYILGKGCEHRRPSGTQRCGPEAPDFRGQNLRRSAAQDRQRKEGTEGLQERPGEVVVR